MEALTIREILEAVHGRLLGDFSDLEAAVTRVETDSRTISPGALFLPLNGERFDGHAYINAALEAGAAGCLTQRERESYLPGKFYIKVDSTHRALRDLAVWYKARFDIPVVAITGSVGKTTTKDMVAAVLSEKFQVLKTEGNKNNDIGLPLTLLRLEKKHQIAVLELGMNHAGELDYLSGIAQPDVVLITNIGDSHIENFGSREKIFEAKCEIFHHAKQGACAVLNGDDPLLATLRGKTPGDAVFCGSGAGLNYRASDLESDWRSQVSCRVDTPRGFCRMDIPALGEHMIYPTLMAAAVGERFGMTLEEIAAGVRNFAPTKMRMNILNRGENITILDDAYNANPQSMRAAIEVLDGYTGDYKVAVLGDMFELGPLASALHAGVGEFLGRSHVDCLVAVGELARGIYDAAAASDVPECHYCATKEEALPVLAGLLRPGTTVLVKASRGMAFESITGYLKEITKEQ
ncbi:UDP-N-acetylmuramoyl-tripeptide--D-alanyl-D-alanine ligase [Candidatus Pseudoscillospira sp. SGI.172]|uniref:UDP-N-acetylmuramoyl-tripeptide--D-alanyl-D- alanine ligase n=1 Tax=Candidatus Pseudoscillospira sp. SGI.172 TaxID=3420582 RepID=UPI0009BAEFD2|nr:UDP-N-acetylmuramoyl-tripeptide--D-alanyl-D-alanine ligase [Pseudoflavonifractor sp.]MDY3019691.1 UDP-N-acetylmuramoyl-tripeptide--D-alanyl-D-alanine ligase [Oscillospiraceae bacterium]